MFFDQLTRISMLHDLTETQTIVNVSQSLINQKRSLACIMTTSSEKAVHSMQVEQIQPHIPISDSTSVNVTKVTLSHLHVTHSPFIVICCIILTIIMGFIVPTQGGLNISLAKQIDSGLRASFVSFTGGALVLTISCLYNCKTSTIPKFKRLFKHLNSHKIEWFLFLNGVFSVVNVTTTIYLAPIIGFALSFVCNISGQIISSIVIDLYHTSKYYKQLNVDISSKRKKRMWCLTAVGLILIFGGVLLFEFNELFDSNKNDDDDAGARSSSRFLSIICIIIAFVSGVCQTIKNVFNRRIKLHTNSSLLAATTNFVIGAMFIGLLALIEYLSDKNSKNIDWGKVRGDEFYIWCGGFIGAFYLTVVGIIMPGIIGYVGAAICARFGSFVISMVYDTIGVFGVKSYELTWNRITGALCIFIALVLVNLTKLLQSSQKNSQTKANSDGNVAYSGIMTPSSPSVELTQKTHERSPFGDVESDG